MAEPAPPDGTVPIIARVPSTLRDAVDRVAVAESRPGSRVSRSAALRLLVLEALVARGQAVSA